MIKKEIHRSYSTENKHHKSHHLSPEKIFLFSGESILFLVLLYLVITNGGATEALHLWIPFVLAGIALFITGRLIR
jgi:VIT1/CCC1 family predicted Fe2+/Mn2+ transporter